MYVVFGRDDRKINWWLLYLDVLLTAAGQTVYDQWILTFVNTVKPLILSAIIFDVYS